MCLDQAQSSWAALSWGTDVLLGQHPCREGDGCNLERPHPPWGAPGSIIPLRWGLEPATKTASKKRAVLLPQLICAPWRKSKKAFNDPSGHNVICIFILSGQAHSTKTPGVEGKSLWKLLAEQDAVRCWRGEEWACVMKVGRWLS